MSEEMKNLNDQQPEETKAPVEEKTEAPKLPFNLSKKTLAIICGAVAAALVLVLVLVLVLGGKDGHTHNYVNGVCECGESDPNYVAPHTHSFVEGKCECGATDPNYVPPHTHNFVEGKCECGETDPNYMPPATNEYTLGMGLVFGDLNNTQINATIATVVLDSNGVIVACKIDAVQNKYTIGDTIVFSNLLTKKELGNDYHMHDWGAGQDRNGDGIVKEWFEQAAAFEAWCVGKTIAEVAAMETQTQADGYVIPADEALLAAGCTIQITDFVDAVVKAGNDDQAMTFTAEGEMVLGLGVKNTDNGSTGDDFEATINMNIDFAAVVTVDGVIVAALNDAAQPKVVVEDGSVISTSVGKGEGVLKTKRELKEDYKMAAWGTPNVVGGTVKEWYIQSAAFSNYIVGKTPAQVAKLETALVNDHYISTDDALLSAGCTMQITGIMEVVCEAAGYVPATNEYTLGMGLVFGDLNNTQINATIATVVLDSNGVIVACKIDAVQNKYTIGDTIVFSNLLTKKELGNDYHMHDWGAGQDRNGDGIVKEWFEQAAAFEAWCVGKTIAEVAAMETQTQADGYVIPADEALLAAGCTIQITDFVDAVVKAGNDDQAMTFTAEGEMVLGLGVKNTDNGSTGDDFEATINMNIDFAAVVTVDGVIVAALNDAAQPKVVVEDGSVISTSVGKGEGVLKTKRELKEDYKMAAWGTPNVVGGTVKEWYIQSAAFSNYIVGLTAEQVANLETTEVNNHFISTDDVLLNAGCTMQITGIMDVVVEACGEAA